MRFKYLLVPAIVFCGCNNGNEEKSNNQIPQGKSSQNLDYNSPGPNISLNPDVDRKEQAVEALAAARKESGEESNNGITKGESSQNLNYQSSGQSISPNLDFDREAKATVQAAELPSTIEVVLLPRKSSHGRSPDQPNNDHWVNQVSSDHERGLPLSIMEPAGAFSGPTIQEQDYAKGVESILAIEEDIRRNNCTPESISTSAYGDKSKIIVIKNENFHVFSVWPTAERYRLVSPNMDGMNNFVKGFAHIKAIWDILEKAMGDRVMPRLPDVVLLDAEEKELADVCQKAAFVPEIYGLQDVDKFEWENSNLRETASLIRDMISILKEVHTLGFHFKHVYLEYFSIRSTGTIRTVVLAPFDVFPNHGDLLNSSLINSEEGIEEDDDKQGLPEAVTDFHVRAMFNLARSLKQYLKGDWWGSKAATWPGNGIITGLLDAIMNAARSPRKQDLAVNYDKWISGLNILML